MSLTDTPTAHNRLRERLDSRRRHGRLLLATGVAASVVAVAAGFAIFSGEDKRGLAPVVPATQPPATGPTEISADAPAALPSTAIAVRGSVRSAGSRQTLAFAGGSLWAVDSTRMALLRIDPGTARQVGSVALRPPAGMSAEAVTAAGDVLVVTVVPANRVTQPGSAPNAAVLLVDARSGAQTASVPTRFAFALDGNRVATGPAGTWMQTDAEQLGLLDTATGRITRRLPVGTSISGFAVGTTAIWVASYDTGSATRVDVATGATASVDSGDRTINAAAVGADGLVWRDGRIVLLSGSAPAIAATANLPYAEGGKADFAAIGQRVFCICGVGGELAVTDTRLQQAKAFTVAGSDGDASITSTADRVWMLLKDGSLLGLDASRL